MGAVTMVVIIMELFDSWCLFINTNSGDSDDDGGAS